MYIKHIFTYINTIQTVHPGAFSSLWTGGERPTESGESAQGAFQFFFGGENKV